MQDEILVMPILLYACVLATYLPGIAVVLVSRNSLKYPLIAFAFGGMFFFNALGSIGVFLPEKIYSIFFDTEVVSEDVALVLILQALVYYIVALPYVLIRRAPLPSVCITRGDYLLLWSGVIVMLALTVLYFLETKTFLLFSAIDGSMGLDNSFEFRMKAIYGLANWPLYNIGMVFLPVATSSYAFIVFNLSNTYRWVSAVAIISSIAISMLLGSKAGIAGFVISLGVAYGVLLGTRNARLIDIVKSYKFSGFILFALLLLYIGYNRASGGEIELAELIERVLYRVFVVGPETIAAAISFVQENGELGLSVFPTMRGFLSHEQVDLSLIIHQHMAGSPGGATLPFSAEAFISAKWGGVIAMSAFVFLMLILLQEVAFRITTGVLSLAFCALLSFLAVRMSTVGVFATYLNFMYPATILIAAILLAGKKWAMRWSNSVNLVGEGRCNANTN